jgi:hypothetical protein
MTARKRRAIWLAVLLSTGSISTTGAGEFNGWCFPAASDVCVGEQRPLTGNKFITCESNCTMSNPVNVRDMDAVIYDVTCSGDWGSRSFRMFISRYVSGDDVKAVAVGEHGPDELERCE